MELPMLLVLTAVVPFVMPVILRYYILQQTQTWSGAQAYCRSKNNDLATIRGASDMVLLQKQATQQNFNLSVTVWIGLYNDINSWRWSYDNTPLGWKNWGAPNPDNWYAGEACGCTGRNSWSDVWCTSMLPFVCFDDLRNVSDQYVFYNGPLTWRAAQQFCRQTHTDLASVKSSTDQSAIAANVSGITWIGLYRNTWKWSDGTNFTSIRWMPNEPNNYMSMENYCYLNGVLAADGPPEDLKAFVCQGEVKGQRQILKLNVKSNQLVNDAVMTELLKMIMQKLMAHGIAEKVTVTYRQPKGEDIFKKLEENVCFADTHCPGT